MKYPARFSEDLKYLASFYEWSQEDKVEVRQAFTDSPETVHFFTVLAAAHRAGYTQCAGNGFQRLGAWCIENGVGDPFGSAFDLNALDNLAVQQRRAVA